MIENDSLTELHAGRISFERYLAEDTSDSRKSGAGTAQNIATGLLAVIAAKLFGFESYWILAIACLGTAAAANAFLPHPYILFRVHDERKAQRLYGFLCGTCLVLLLIAGFTGTWL